MGQRDAEAQRLHDLFEATADALPLVLLPDGTVLRGATLSELAAALGLRTTTESTLYDLVVVGAGILTAVLSLARLLAWLLTHQPVLLWSFFFGLVLASLMGGPIANFLIARHKLEPKVLEQPDVGVLHEQRRAAVEPEKRIAQVNCRSDTQQREHALQQDEKQDRCDEREREFVSPG